MTRLMEKLLSLTEEYAREGTVSGSPLSDTAKGYDDVKVKEFAAVIKEYGKSRTRFLRTRFFTPAHMLSQ
jgi:hypothetical protein